jgi:plastocyanin
LQKLIIFLSEGGVGMNTKKLAIWLIASALIIGGVYYFSRSGVNAPTSVPSSKSMEIGTSVPASGNTVEITANGFSPSEIKIKKGDTVTWMNKDASPHWPASAAHPTHTVYPGSDIKKCGTSAQFGIFDACKGLATGESFSFKFDQIGTWKYHDHLKPAAPFFGSVVVE